MRILILTLLILSRLYPCVAQQEGNTWIFGDSAAINFNNGLPIPLPGSIIYPLECSSSISDSSGSLLFYTGRNMNFGSLESVIVNKYHDIINNGTEIYCNTSSTQGALLLPAVNNPNLIYLITHRLDASIPDYKYYYSVIDKSSNNDSGAVIVKNIPLPGVANMSEHLQVVKHGNGRDWWLIAHKGNGNQFYIYLIDSLGIQGPNIQSLGNSFPLTSAAGQIKISPDGNKIIIVNLFGHIDLFS
jgi:hypothetical protein